MFTEALPCAGRALGARVPAVSKPTQGAGKGGTDWEKQRETEGETEPSLEGAAPGGAQSPHRLARAAQESSVSSACKVLGKSLQHCTWAALFFLNCGITFIIFSPVAWDRFAEGVPPNVH